MEVVVREWCIVPRKVDWVQDKHLCIWDDESDPGGYLGD